MCVKVRRGSRLTRGLLRGLVERPEEAPLIDRDLWQEHTTRGAEVVEGSACGPVTCFSKHRWR